MVTMKKKNLFNQTFDYSFFYLMLQWIDYKQQAQFKKKTSGLIIHYLTHFYHVHIFFYSTRYFISLAYQQFIAL